MDGISSIGKLLIAIGIICIGVGVVILFLGKFIHLGRLPGDLFFSNEHGSFYFPIVSCIIISVILSVIMSLFHR